MVDSREDDGFVDMSASGPEVPADTAVDLEVALDLRPRTTAQIVDFGVEVLMKRVVPIVGLCALIWLPLRILMPFLNEVQSDLLVNGSADSATDATMFLMVSLFGAAIGQMLASIASIATVTLLVYGDLIGRPVTIGEAGAGALKRMFGLIGVMLTTAVILMLSMGVLLVLGVLCPIFLPVSLAAYLYLSWRLAVAPSAMVLEGLGVMESVRRSWDLSKGSFGRWIGVSFLTFVLVIGFGTTIGVMDEPGARAWVVSTIGMPELAVTALFVAIGAVLAGIGTAFSAAAQTVYYLDLRMRRDGLDLLMRLERLSALG